MKSTTIYRVKNRLFFTALAILFAITISFVPLGIARADTAQQSYNLFWGKVTTTAGTPAVGVPVTAWINGVQASGTIITDATGQ